VHFFNPVPVTPLAEVISALRTSGDVVAQASAFITDGLGKQVIHAKDRAGLVVNSLVVPYLLHAVRTLKAGIASAENIDNGMRLGCGLPMGPLAPVSGAVMASSFRSEFPCLPLTPGHAPIPHRIRPGPAGQPRFSRPDTGG